MTWKTNRQHHIRVYMYNESDPVISDTGLVTRSKEEDVLLNILLLRTKQMMFYDKNGRFVEDGIIFQISKKELNDNSFTIYTGKTFVKYDSEIWRIMSKTDYSHERHTQLIECKAVKVINAD